MHFSWPVQCRGARDTILPIAVSLALLLCCATQTIKPTLAQASISGSISGSSSGGGGSSSGSISGSSSGGGSSSSSSGGGGGGGGLLGAAAGAISGGIAGAAAGAEAGSQSSNSGASASGQVQLSGGSSGSSSSSNSGSSSSSGGSSGASLSASGSASTGGGSSSAQASGSISFGSTTSKPDGGILGKVKEIFKDTKESVKSSVDNLTRDDKSKSTASAGVSLEASGSMGGGSAQASAKVSAGSEPRQEGLIDKLSDMAKRGKESIKETASEIKEKAKEVKEEVKQAVGLSDQQQVLSGEGGSLSAAGSVKLGGVQANANINLNGGSGGSGGSGGFSAGSSSGSGAGASFSASASSDIQQQQQQQNYGEQDSSGPIEKVQKIVNKGSEIVRETVNKIEDKVSEVGEKVFKSVDDNIRRPMQQVSGSGQQLPEGHLSAQASANVQLRGDARERYLMDVKRRQESEIGQRPSNLKDIISQAKAKGVIPRNEDRSVLLGNHADEKSVAVEVLDKMHEISKMPVERVLRPIDKVLGYEKDPLIRIYDNSHEILRRPISLVSKPVESVLTGAFKTTDEAKREQERLLQTTSEQERREARIREERARKEGRSVVGEIADRTLELAEKPFEIILKPVDHILGLDKNGKKNPLIRIVDDFYSLSKKPVDALAKPFETILRKMADGEQAYQVSVRFQSGRPSNEADPKLVTRLADGALNIADRVITKPLEIVMKPLNHALGYDEPGKRNPIVDAAHSLKNATKLGVELFTRPIDRIIKEIADIGAIKNDAEREAMLERKREEASRLVKALDKIHEFAQSPWEIVLRPVDRALGISREGRKEPLLRAWDVIHQVVRAPIQVVSKPVEDAILGEQPRGPPGQGRSGAKAQISGQIGGIKGQASVNLGGGGGGSGSNYRGPSLPSEEHRRNVIIEGIKKVERLASKPLDVITSPIRRLILGEDDEKGGSDTDKSNRAAQAKAMGQSPNGRFSAQVSLNGGGSSSNGGPDKIIKTIENMNNVVLKPLEVITQPISDMLASDDRRVNGQQQQSGGNKKLEVKVQGKMQSSSGGVGGGGSSSGSSSSASSSNNAGESGSSSRKEMYASAQAQIKKN